MDTFRTFVAVALVLSSIYLVFMVLVSVVKDYKAIKSTGDTSPNITINNNIQDLLPKELTGHLIKKSSFDSMRQEIEILKMRLDSMEKRRGE